MLWACVLFNMPITARRTGRSLRTYACSHALHQYTLSVGHRATHPHATHIHHGSNTAVLVHINLPATPYTSAHTLTSACCTGFEACAPMNNIRALRKYNPASGFPQSLRKNREQRRSSAQDGDGFDPSPPTFPLGTCSSSSQHPDPQRHRTLREGGHHKPHDIRSRWEAFRRVFWQEAQQQLPFSTIIHDIVRVL